jgi:hypothetical protein
MSVPLRLGELRALIRTPDVRRPRVYVCRGCRLPFRAGEAHDFTLCAAKVAANRCNLGIAGNTACCPNNASEGSTAR